MDSRSLVSPEPAPIPNDGEACWPRLIAYARSMRSGRIGDLLIADMEARHAVGMARYGTPLQPHNGRDALVDAYQEVLDGAVYFQQVAMEGVNDTWAVGIVHDMIELAAKIRARIEARDRGVLPRSAR